ncbi:MAG: DUF1801 domain-containing protein [Bacteroidia bacterium]
MQPQLKQMGREKKIKVPNLKLTVDGFLEGLNPELVQLINAVREIILNTESSIDEQIKWNSPSFFYTGEMKPFNPKEYKRDICVMNLNKNYVMLVFPTGAKITDGKGILEGNFPDGRKIAHFKNLQEVADKKSALQSVIKEWLSLIEK